MAYVDTTGLDNAAVLAALYAVAPVGTHVTPEDPEAITVEEARLILGQYPGVDYLYNRPIKVTEFEENGFEAAFFDRAAGEGTAQRAVDELRRKAGN